MDKDRMDLVFGASSVLYTLLTGGVESNTSYRIDKIVNYLDSVIEDFEAIKESRLVSEPVYELRALAGYFGINELPREDADSRVAYIQDNLENFVHQLEDLRENPEGFFSREDRGLRAFVSEMHNLFSREYSKVPRDLEEDD